MIAPVRASVERSPRPRSVVEVTEHTEGTQSG
jgi:hypothetical protein